MTNQYIATFTDDSKGAVRICGECPAFQIGLAKREDGYMRCVFLCDGSLHDADPWIARISALNEPRVTA